MTSVHQKKESGSENTRENHGEGEGETEKKRKAGRDLKVKALLLDCPLPQGGVKDFPPNERKDIARLSRPLHSTCGGGAGN